MAGPLYQQFQEYPNPVGNYFSGLDAGRARATEDFNTRQTLETQNALVQQSGAQSYPQLQAQQMQAKQMMEMYQPALQNAIENENYAMRDAIVGALKKSGNPILGTFAGIAGTAKKLDKGAYGYDVTFPDTETGRAQRQAMWSKDAFLQSVYPSADQIQLGVSYRVTTQGMPGAPQSHTSKFEAVSRTSAKPGSTVVDVKEKTQFDDLREKYDGNQEALDIIDQGEKIYDANPANGVRLDLPGTGKFGAKAIKASAAANKPVAISSEAQVRPLIMDLPPRIADEIIRTVRDPANKGKVIYFETGSDGKLTGRVHKFGPALNERGLKGFIQLRTIPGATVDRATGKMYVNKRDSETGKIEKVEMDSLTVQEQAKYWGPELKKLGQAGSPQAAQAYVTADLYEQETKDLAAIRARIKKNNPDGWSGIQSKFRKVNSLEQMVALNTGDDPDLAEFVKGTTLLADVLMRAVGGQQGGQWAFELAAKLLDPTLPDQAYKATLNKHLRTLKERAGQWKGVGKEGSSGFVEQPSVPGLTSKSPPPSLDEFIKTKVIQYPKYKSKTRAEWQAAYDKLYSGGQ